METENKIHEKQCEICGKKFASMYEEQLKWNFRSHMQTHDFDPLKKEIDNGANEV